MILTKTLSKKILEQIIKECFIRFDTIQSCLLLDSLKILGFSYATKSGLSINIEDLKTPEEKQNILEENNDYIQKVSEEWYQGKLSDTERFQSIIDQWNVAGEALKDQIINFYQKYDPANNLYIMAFSGARGNMTQVRQLVGMRGLMADQEGNIIDLPIQKNFREGLSSLDYLISSYGARKGTVDTALKTADAGYLTRRLIYLAQDLIIKEIDCKTLNGIKIVLNYNYSGENLIGRYLMSTFNYSNEFEFLKGKIITEKSLNLLKKRKNLELKIRSCLTCASPSSICQKCYGWDLAKRSMVCLGETVGIIAAQSIGEPGTQLTMRTFHTGGIFTSELLNQKRAPFSGKLIFPERLQRITCRTSHGLIADKLQQEGRFKIIDWQGIERNFNVPLGSLLHTIKSGFVEKGEIIAEASSRSALLPQKRLKPLYSPIQGEISFDKLKLKSFPVFNQKGLKLCIENGVLWIDSGKLLDFPYESKINITNSKVSNKISIAKTKIICPRPAIILIEKDKIKLIEKNKKVQITFSKISLDRIRNVNLNIKLNLICVDKQFIDAYSIIAYIHFFPNENYKIYRSKNVYSKFLKSFFFITDLDVWTISVDEMRNQYTDFKVKELLQSNDRISKNLINKRSGRLLEKDGLVLTFQTVYPIFLTRGTLVAFSEGNFIFKGDSLAFLINYRQQNEDIVQGLPKIDALIEARPPEQSAFLINSPNILLKLKKKHEDYEELLEIQKQASSHRKKIKIRLYNFIKLEKSKKKNKKKKKISFYKDSFFTPPGILLSFDNIVVKRNPRRNFIAYKLGARKRKILKLDIPHRNMSFINLLEGLTSGLINSHDVLKRLNAFHRKRSGPLKGSIKSLNKFQIILVHSIQAIYTSQGVDISAKHLEIVVRQLTTKAKIISIPEIIPFHENEQLRLSFMIELVKSLPEKWKHQVNFEPILLSSVSSSLNKGGFLTAAGFQETKRVLTRAALEGKKDWLKGLKECIITGRLIPAGSAFLNYKNYLDTLYFYKGLNKENDLINNENLSNTN